MVIDKPQYIDDNTDPQIDDDLQYPKADEALRTEKRETGIDQTFVFSYFFIGIIIVNSIQRDYPVLGIIITTITISTIILQIKHKSWEGILLYLLNLLLIVLLYLIFQLFYDLGIHISTNSSRNVVLVVISTVFIVIYHRQLKKQYGTSRSEFNEPILYIPIYLFLALLGYLFSALMMRPI